MSESIIVECRFWVASIMTGFGMSFVYDLIRLYRSLVRHNRILTDIEDIIYWIGCFFAAFTLLYYGNSGVIRFAAVFGAAVGMVIYIVTLGRVLVSFLSFVIKRILHFIKKVIMAVIKPILYILHKTKCKITKKMSRIKNILTKMKKKLTINTDKHTKKRKGGNDNGEQKKKSSARIYAGKE